MLQNRTRTVSNGCIIAPAAGVHCLKLSRNSAFTRCSVKFCLGENKKVLYILFDYAVTMTTVA